MTDIKSSIFIVSFPCGYLGGTAVIKSVSEKSAYKALCKKSDHVRINVPFEKCKFEQLENRDGVLYFYDGDY